VAPIGTARDGVRAWTWIQNGRIDEVVEGPGAASAAGAQAPLPAIVPAPRPHRQRHDGFTPKKQRKFFKALKKTGCLSDAARAAGISRNTVRRHRLKWPAFERKLAGALAMASVELDMIAWQRAVEGVPEIVIRDGEVAWIKIKPSDAILRLLMQGANPRKYGRTGGPPGRAQGKRPRIATNAEVREALAGRLAAFRDRVRARRAATGLPPRGDGADGEAEA
jgi:hypothetical protein